MQLRVAFEAAVGPLRPSGEAIVEFSMHAEEGHICFEIANIEFVDHRLYKLVDTIFNLSEPLTQQLNVAVNRAIADLPKRNPHIRKLEILDLNT